MTEQTCQCCLNLTVSKTKYPTLTGEAPCQVARATSLRRRKQFSKPQIPAGSDKNLISTLFSQQNNLSTDRHNPNILTFSPYFSASFGASR
jgi:hypothetical protein